MKTLSIIPSDSMVIIDGVARQVDCSTIDPIIHAIQWNAKKERGHIEFVDEDPDDGQRAANESIASIEPYLALIGAWESVPATTTAKPMMAPDGGANVIG